MSQLADGLTSLARRLAGRPADWHLRRPTLALPRPGAHWVGPLLVLASVTFTWTAFTGAIGEEGDITFGLWVGSTSIVLMAWSFLLALRLRLLEPMFGGLDSMYRVHRWVGAASVVAMFLHTQEEPEIEDGIRGASKSMAEAAQDLAGTGETIIYILVGISLVRWIPYRYWRWTHKLLGIPFAFACWHFYTVEKPYSNGSGWGLYFNAAMCLGLVTWLWRVVVRDMWLRGHTYRVSTARTHASTTELELEPIGEPLRHEAGQFAVLKLDAPGLREPHVFTIASTPDSAALRFFIRDLGDWSAQLANTALLGTRCRVEGPYGRFAPFHGGGRTVWVAGGVGITPFLSAIDSLTPGGSPPTLFYCVGSRDDATALPVLEQAHAAGTLDLQLRVSGEGNRFGHTTLVDHFGAAGLDGAHVAVCGPAGLVATARAAARRAGAGTIETEGFDIRSGFGPDLSRDVESAIGGVKTALARLKSVIRERRGPTVGA